MQQQLVFFMIISIKNPGRISKKLLNYCKLLNIDNINFPPTIKDIEQFEKDNPNIPITTFERGGSKKIDDDDDDDDNDDNDNKNNSNNNNAFTNIEKYDDSESTGVNINTNQTNTKKLKREYPIKKNDATQRKHLVELLIIRDGENKHFFTISNISRLLSGSKHDRGMHYCKKCYCSFRIIETLNVFIHIIIIFIQR